MPLSITLATLSASTNYVSGTWVSLDISAVSAHVTKISILNVAATLSEIVISCATTMASLTVYYANKQASREVSAVEILQVPYEIIS